MSFIDLATLAMHRRNEMESRINIFLKKCDQSIKDINKLKFKAQGFVQQLNCDPSDLKGRFLKCMKQLDEFTYLITDFNLAFENIEQLGSTEHTPVHDMSNILTPVEVQRPSLIDILSEPTPSTSTACGNFCQTVKTKHKKIPKEEQILIQFSSGSNSSESVLGPCKSLTEKGVQYEVQEEFKELTVGENNFQNIEKEVPATSIPAQAMAQVDKTYSGTIMSVDGTNFWVIMDDFEEACNLMTEMTEYYKECQNKFDMEDTSSLTYCAYFDEDSDCYYRGLLIRLNEEDVNVAEVFLVDTGEMRSVRAGSTRPLAARFAASPPYARCCHLAGVDLLKCHNKNLLEKQEEFMKFYIGRLCTIEVDDNTSESLGVYVKINDKETLNELIVKEGLALAVDKPAVETTSVEVPPELVNSDIDITEGPEHEDPVEAVAGYHNRDEADICQFYKGGPEKTCFKGARCKKRHVLKHPDGWTLDRVEVRCKLPSLPLPLVDSWHEVLVTHVCHFNKLYVQLQTANKQNDRPPNFGVILPPTNLESLHRDMNSPASRQAYKPLTMAPAPGEIVAALYPPDEKWYRAQVISTTRSDQNVEVMYVDYGNMVWVREDSVRALQARWCALPVQAVRCVLAGVAARAACSRTWARATALLADMLHDRKLQAHVVGRTYDELIVELIDKDGYSIAEQLAAHEVVTLHKYDVHDDSKVSQRVVVP